MALFLVCFLASTVAPEQTLPALGFSGYDDLTIRLYGIFQLSWALLFYFAQKNPEKNLAIIHSAIVTGSLVAALLLFTRSPAGERTGIFGSMPRFCWFTRPFFSFSSQDRRGLDGATLNCDRAGSLWDL